MVEKPNKTGRFSQACCVFVTAPWNSEHFRRTDTFVCVALSRHKFRSMSAIRLSPEPLAATSAAWVAHRGSYVGNQRARRREGRQTMAKKPDVADHEMDKKVGGRITAFRVLAGLSQDAVAAALDRPDIKTGAAI